MEFSSEFQGSAKASKPLLQRFSTSYFKKNNIFNIQIGPLTLHNLDMICLNKVKSPDHNIAPSYFINTFRPVLHEKMFLIGKFKSSWFFIICNNRNLI